MHTICDKNLFEEAVEPLVYFFSTSLLQQVFTISKIFFEIFLKSLTMKHNLVSLSFIHGMFAEHSTGLVNFEIKFYAFSKLFFEILWVCLFRNCANRIKARANSPFSHSFYSSASYSFFSPNNCFIIIFQNNGYFWTLRRPSLVLWAG